MARELSLEVEVLGTVEADAALARLFNAFVKAGDSAEVASAKVEKFEKSFKEGAARKAARKELDDLAASTTGAGGAAQKAASETSMLTSAVMRFAAPAAVGAAIARTLNWADSVSDLAAKHRMSTDAVQQLTGVAEKNGATFGRYAGLMETASDRIARGNKRTTDALAEMGLEVESLRGLDPYTITSELAKGLNEIDDPARRAAIRMALFGESGGDALQMVNALNEGIEKLVPVVDADMVAAGDKAIEMWGRFKNVVMATTNEAILQSINPLVQMISYFDDLTTSLDAAAYSSARLAALLPGRPGAFGGAGGLPVPGDPQNGVAGQSYDFLNKSLTPKIAAERSARAKVLPFQQRTFALGSSAASIFGMANTPGGFNAGSLPFNASPGLLASGGSPIDFMNGMQLPAGVSMNAPGGGGGIGSYLKNNKARIGIGLGTMAAGYLGNRIGGKAGGALSGASQGAQMGMMFGPWGAAVGGVVGGVAGWIGAGKKAKNAINQEKSDVFSQFSSKEFIEMQKQADRLGVSLQKALTAKTMKDFGAAVDEATKKIKAMTDLEDEIKSLTEAATVDFDKMNAIVQEFGLDIAKMGPAFQQAAMDKEFQKIIDALAVMERGGADMNGVLDGMQDEISKVVNDSIKFGTTIPENMKPWINKLIESGKLLDENGQVITDTSKMKFGAPMVSEMDKVVKKLDELIAKLADLAAGFRDAGTAAGDLGNSNPGGGSTDGGNPDGGQSQNGSGSPGFATGGVAGRDFRRPGYGDIFPALLKRGERVLPAGVGGGVSLTIGNLSVGGGYGSRTEAVEQIGEAVVEYLERRGARLVA